jgi:alpha-acetolactate decarboxylase
MTVIISPETEAAGECAVFGQLRSGVQRARLRLGLFSLEWNKAMRSSKTASLVIVSMLGALAATAPTAAAERFDVQAYGNFKRVLHAGDTAGKVRLAAVSGRPHTYGVGALAEMRGEVLLWDGRMLVTPGHDSQGRTIGPEPDQEATLFVSARVSEWAEVPIPSDFTRPELEQFVRDAARRRGLSDADPYPFVVKGDFARVLWHVVTGRGGESSAVHALGHAGNRVFDDKPAQGILLGFYSGEKLEGVVSHPGERFHVHFAHTDFAASGHADDYAVRKGATLLLPVR